MITRYPQRTMILLITGVSALVLLVGVLAVVIRNRTARPPSTASKVQVTVSPEASVTTEAQTTALLATVTTETAESTAEATVWVDGTAMTVSEAIRAAALATTSGPLDTSTATVLSARVPISTRTPARVPSATRTPVPAGAAGGSGVSTDPA